MQQSAFNQGLLDFIQASPTPFHAVATMVKQLEAQGFTQLREATAWQLTPGERYYLVRNDSSLIAFVYGTAPLETDGIRMVGAHTDSPCLRVKPQPQRIKQGLLQLGVEVYGGALLNPWFDRDLSLAGRVNFVDEAGQLQHCLIDFQQPIATIPSLAIHLDRDVNNNRQINPQKDIPPVLSIISKDNGSGESADGNTADSFDTLLANQIQCQYPQQQVARILSHELSFYDTQAPALIGLQQDFIASARLDNLASCYIGLQALLAADNQHSNLLICNDHEEVGSQSAVGASGPMLNDFLERLVPHGESRQRLLAASLLISADNAHGIHPNYSDRHDENHGPLLNAGPVIKINANQRYATNSHTSAIFQQLAAAVGVPVQSFVTRTDLACGSTIGPLTATAVGVATLDVGIPTFAMHSIRELAGSADAYHLYQIFLQFSALDQVSS